jgi:hypothetical protein
MYSTSLNTINCCILNIYCTDKFFICIRIDNGYYFDNFKDLVFTNEMQCVFVAYVLNC